MRKLVFGILFLLAGQASAGQPLAPPAVGAGPGAGQNKAGVGGRPPGRAETGVATGARTIDMRAPDFLEQIEALKAANPDKQLAFICRTGHRSTIVVQGLEAQGLKDLINVTEGMKGSDKGPGWLARKLPVSQPQ